jgi:thiol:disulfide interchange protein DsbC
MNRTVLAFFSAVLLALPVFAQGASEAEVKKAVDAWLATGAGSGPSLKAESVRKAGFLNLYEVVVNGDVLYTDEKVSYVLLGNVIETKSRKDLTEERKNKLAQIKFSDLPLELAIKQVKGSGKRVLATFEDPNCTYCKKLAKEVQGLTDVTIYTFLFPILSPDSIDKSKAIWCSADRAKAWNDLMLNGTAPTGGKCDTAALDKVMDLGRRLNVRGTPALFLADGTRIPGFMPTAKLDEAITKAGGN